MSVRSAEELQALTASLEALPVVAAVHAAVPGPTDPHVELVLVTGVERVPPAVLRVLARQDAGITSVKPQGVEPEQQLVVEVAA
jgi:hypothetical protein